MIIPGRKRRHMSEIIRFVIGSSISSFIFLIGFYILKILEEKTFRSARYERWKTWKTVNTNSRLYKLHVLFGWRHSPTFEYFDVIRCKIYDFEKDGYSCEVSVKDVKKGKEE